MVGMTNLYHFMGHLLIVHQTVSIVLMFDDLPCDSLADTLGSSFLSPSRGSIEYILDLKPTNSKMGLSGLSSLNFPGTILFLSQNIPDSSL